MRALMVALLTAGLFAAAAAATTDFEALEDRIVKTKAIGVFTKLSLKSDVEHLKSALVRYYDGKSTMTLDEIREQYYLMAQKLLALIQRKDPELAADIAAARDPFWAVLSDEQAFSRL